MADWFDYNPLTGITSEFTYDNDTGNLHVKRSQDLDPFLDYVTEVRNAGFADQKRKKHGGEYAMHALLPTLVIAELLQKGIDIADPNCTKRLTEEIERNYPHCKLTNKVHIAR
jgi:hypothetical protein